MRIVIIGGGIVGLNIALAAARNNLGDEIFLLEQEQFLGHHTTTRNSEVIHAGFAYPPGSLKAKLCVEGNRLTYELLKELDIPHSRCGKWIIACDDREEAALHDTIKNAIECGISTLKMSSVSELKKMVPQIHDVKAVAFSPDSGILDVSSYIQIIEAWLSNDERVQIVYPCEVTAIDKGSRNIATTRGDMEYDILINAAGLMADDVYEMAEKERRYQIIPFKGEYYTWRHGRVDGLVYPVPTRFLKTGDESLVSSMGIHAHRNIAGEQFLGPSQIQGKPDQKFDYSITTPPEKFVEEVSRYMTGVKVEDLNPAFAGNRPKLYENGKAMGDFQIFRKGDVIHLVGIESPGLTASPAIAKMVVELAKG